MRRVSNPPNPWQRWRSEDLGPAPVLAPEVYIDDARSILSRNDSPDLPFTWSLNPYRGCQHACAYCLSGDTPILMADSRPRLLKALKVGDEIYGTELRGQRRRLVKTRVLAHWQTVKPAFRVTLRDGTTLVASGDHRFLTRRGWKHVTGAEQGALRRPHLTENNTLLGLGALASPPDKSREHSLAYLSGAIQPRPGLETGATDLRVAAIEPLGVALPLFDITTGTGDFIANGVVSHNCYARPTHEYWGFGAGTDFDAKIIIKPDAPRLLKEAFERRSWKGQLIVLSGNTDCYQPFEAVYKLTRACLELCLEYRQPVSIITKGALIERDLDLLKALSKVAFAQVRVSLCAMDAAWIRALEPMAPSPGRRLKTIKALSAAGISVGVMAAPVIPGLTEAEAPKVFKAARQAGAGFAEWALLRLPGSAAAVFAERLEQHFPGKAARVLKALSQARGGVIEGRPGDRFKGEGARWETASKLLRLSARRLGFQEAPKAPERSPFRRPGEGEQLMLFD